MKRARKIFCIDVGNTRTHCALVSYLQSESPDDAKPARGASKGASRGIFGSAKRADFSVLFSLDYPTRDFPRLLADPQFSPLSKYAKSLEAVVYCSVVPKISKRIDSFFRKSEFSERYFNLNNTNSPIPLDVDNPARVGQDRIADAIGASLFLKPPYIVVDMGTAVTIDFVDSHGAYAGGAIAPGLHAFTDYLSERAAQLPKIDLSDDSEIPDIGKNTESAMRVGCVKGFWKLAQGVISDIETARFGGKSSRRRTVFTGGSIGLLPKKWLAQKLIECNLAPLGLAYFYILKQNRTKSV